MQMPILSGRRYASGPGAPAGLSRRRPAEGLLGPGLRVGIDSHHVGLEGSPRPGDVPPAWVVMQEPNANATRLNFTVRLELLLA
jgi:hypothetical protein